MCSQMADAGQQHRQQVEEEITRIISPAVSKEAPYAKVMIRELAELIVKAYRWGYGDGAHPVLQDWVVHLPLMQQTVLLTAIRGPDNTPKYGPVKMLMRWYRRCVLLSAFDRAVLPDPVVEGGGSFTGPSVVLTIDDATWHPAMNAVVDHYLRSLDALPHHFQLHFMHAAEILGYKHPDDIIRPWWHSVYLKLVKDMHVHPETEVEMDKRLGDNREGWLERNNAATVD